MKNKIKWPARMVLKDKSTGAHYGDIKAAIEFKKMLNDIRLFRLRTGKNDTLLSYKRLTLAASRSPIIKKILMESEIKDVTR